MKMKSCWPRSKDAGCELLPGTAIPAKFQVWLQLRQKRRHCSGFTYFWRAGVPQAGSCSPPRTHTTSTHPSLRCQQSNSTQHRHGHYPLFYCKSTPTNDTIYFHIVSLTAGNLRYCHFHTWACFGHSLGSSCRRGCSDRLVRAHTSLFPCMGKACLYANLSAYYIPCLSFYSCENCYSHLKKKINGKYGLNGCLCSCSEEILLINWHYNVKIK